MASKREPPALIGRWEGLHVVTQVLIVAPVAIVVLWAAHVWLMNQPTGRGLLYGVFWGLLATAAIVGASRSEAARRNSA
jgi:hypothetical protein